MNSASKPGLRREEVHRVLWALAAEHFEREPGALKPDQRLVQDLGADSLGVVEMSMQLEDKLDIQIPEEVLDKAELTLGDIESAICKE